LETFYEIKPALLAKSAIALGFFDGVHLGHQVVIGNAVRRARELGAVPGVVTFRDHPRTLTQGAAPLLLTVIEQRLALFEKLGVEAVLVLSFNEDLCRLGPRDYVETVLVGAMGAKSISVGYNHHFGRDREGDPALLKTLGQLFDFDVQVAQAVYIDGLEVSSSKIRESLFQGDLPVATRLLSRPYALYGEVVEGDGRGRKLGFPTVNISLYEFQVVPKPGVYAGKVYLERGLALQSVINVGYRPTFNEMQRDQIKTEISSVQYSQRAGITVEAHILDFAGELYHKRLDLSFEKYLRPEQKFVDVEALKAQIETDCAVARVFFAEEELRSADSAAQPSQTAHA